MYESAILFDMGDFYSECTYYRTRSCSARLGSCYINTQQLWVGYETNRKRELSVQRELLSSEMNNLSIQQPWNVFVCIPLIAKFFSHRRVPRILRMLRRYVYTVLVTLEITLRLLVKRNWLRITLSFLSSYPRNRFQLNHSAIPYYNVFGLYWKCTLL